MHHRFPPLRSPENSLVFLLLMSKEFTKLEKLAVSAWAVSQAGLNAEKDLIKQFRFSTVPLQAPITLFALNWLILHRLPDHTTKNDFGEDCLSDFCSLMEGSLQTNIRVIENMSCCIPALAPSMFDSNDLGAICKFSPIADTNLHLGSIPEGAISYWMNKLNPPQTHEDALLTMDDRFRPSIKVPKESGTLVKGRRNYCVWWL